MTKENIDLKKNIYKIIGTCSCNFSAQSLSVEGGDEVESCLDHREKPCHRQQQQNDTPSRNHTQREFLELKK